MYSVNHKSLDEVKVGVTIRVPQDAVNQERAVRLIEELVWVKFESDAEVINFNVNSVEPAKHKMNFKVLDSAQILVSLKDLDFGIVKGK
ncbi:UNVERIFIED_CONTAM: ABC-type metal ion transport system substrate-binding protein [Paenibacillus sp. PvR008]